ncbi:uncharacterized protein SPPG_00674 [Spizellomyces punctatus DAOM BR117]|uniref:mRNA-decapping enzyme C-terminal domain-containing protein n=1 Tax=Spizellomyces punctatus (strain DAOM BR117) TaxID=645134 RepID=A0A0L0HUG1_SPIPD|nr:uncharacterized protein SPPG_00674 [Spizellomyces punctatus DAOM BR117]KND04991.1 hypothetical protein SPPG_00674 [Spizellomyces punctatus DAOM BR117]|eukprot:XP_016613030.1 hypothetical protein SPPG_00674 [Spizellomyces punctatus DAOM BR117]
MDPAARLAVNLNVLRRHDSNIVAILDSSSHVVVYDFDQQSSSWTKKGIEGTMFVFQRSVEPFYGLFVMNRLGIENLMVLLSADMEVQLMQEFVIYRKPDDSGDSVQGLWMYETADRTRLYTTLLKYQSAIAGAPPISSAQPQQAYGQPVDIMAMFQRAKIVGPGDATPHGSLPHQSLSQRDLAIPQVTAPPITPQQRQIQRLNDIWQWIEDLPPLPGKGSLSDLEFQRRIARLCQDQVFLDAMYRSYRWERPT